MADISKITLPSGSTYNFKDAKAREDIAAIEAAISGGVTFMGKTTTPLTDGATTSPIVIDGNNVTPIKGYLVVYESQEFIWDGTKWLAFGDIGGLGALAYKNNASGSYTPAGSITQPTFSGSSMTATGNFTPSGSVTAPQISIQSAGSTTTVNSITNVGTLPSFLATVSSENLTLTWDQGTLPSKGSNTTVKTGDATYVASAPTFSGTSGSISVSGTPSGSVSQPSFSGTSATITVS